MAKTGPDPILCFVDTQHFIQAGFNINSKQLRLLSHLARHKHIRLLLPDITRQELEKHLAEHAKLACQRISTALKKSRCLSFAGSRHQSLVDSMAIDEAAMIAQTLDGFKKYLQTLNPIRVKHDGLLVDPILNDHFALRAPFSPSKPNEFKDAICLHAIRQYEKAHPQYQIIFLTSDRDYSRAFEPLDVTHVCITSADELSEMFPKAEDTEVAEKCAAIPLAPKVKDALRRWAEEVPVISNNGQGSLEVYRIVIDIDKPLVIAAESKRASSELHAELWWTASVHLETAPSASEKAQRLGGSLNVEPHRMMRGIHNVAVHATAEIDSATESLLNYSIEVTTPPQLLWVP